jgi:hypothetical protein
MVLSFPKYLAISYFVQNGIFPKDATRNDKRKIRYQGSKYFLSPGGRLLEKGTNKELLHECNAFDVILKVHKEGHTGIARTRRKVLFAYTIQGVEDIVKIVVKGCVTCQTTEKNRHLKNNYGQIMKTPIQPMMAIGCDAIGPMTETISGNKYILTAVCHLTRYPIAKAVSDINEETTLKFILEEIITSFGCCKYFLTDRGANFTSDYVQAALKNLGCKPITTTAYRPQTNGCCERLNGSLTGVLRKICKDKDKLDRWDEIIPYALMVLRSTVNTSTGYTPYYLLFGYEMRTPATWTPPIEDFTEGEESEALVERITKLQIDRKDLLEKARITSDDRKAKNKINYDGKVFFPRKFEVGDRVLLKEMVLQEKLADTWIGPFTVIKCNKNGTVHLVGKNSRKIQGAINGDRLKPFREHRNMIPEVQPIHKEAYQRWKTRRNEVYTVCAPSEFKSGRAVSVVKYYRQDRLEHYAHDNVIFKQPNWQKTKRRNGSKETKLSR